MTYTTKELLLLAVGYSVGLVIAMLLWHSSPDTMFAQIYAAFSFIGVAWASKKLSR